MLHRAMTSDGNTTSAATDSLIQFYSIGSLKKEQRRIIWWSLTDHRNLHHWRLGGSLFIFFSCAVFTRVYLPAHTLFYMNTCTPDSPPLVYFLLSTLERFVSL